MSNPTQPPHDSGSGERAIYYCVMGERCVCGGDTPGVRAGCSNWRAALATPSQAPEPAAAKALEFAEYVAKGAEEFMDATDNAAMKRAAADGAPRDDHRPLLCDRADQADSDAVDALRALQRGIYEFRKRAAKVVTPSQAVASALQAPEGWKLVPIEPTPEMVRAVMMAVRPGTALEIANTVWQEMLAAAPAHPVVQPGIQGDGHQAGASLLLACDSSESDPLPPTSDASAR